MGKALSALTNDVGAVALAWLPELRLWRSGHSAFQ